MLREVLRANRKQQLVVSHLELAISAPPSLRLLCVLDLTWGITADTAAVYRLPHFPYRLYHRVRTLQANYVAAVVQVNLPPSRGKVSGCPAFRGFCEGWDSQTPIPLTFGGGDDNLLASPEMLLKQLFRKPHAFISQRHRFGSRRWIQNVALGMQPVERIPVVPFPRSAFVVQRQPKQRQDDLIHFALVVVHDSPAAS